MDNERWYNLLESVEEKIGFEDRGEDSGPGKAVIEWVTFQGQAGLMKLERITKPIVVDRKVRYSKRIGGEVDEELVYSETEKSHRVVLYRATLGGGWEEVDFRQLTG